MSDFHLAFWIRSFKPGEPGGWPLTCEQNTCYRKWSLRCQPKFSELAGNIRWFTYRPHSTLPHLYEVWGGGVDQAGILGPSRTCPLWHGQHCHGRCQQCECTTLENGQSGNTEVKREAIEWEEPDRYEVRLGAFLNSTYRYHEVRCSKIAWLTLTALAR